MLFPIEVKKTASPSKKDARNLNAIDPVTFDDVPVELRAFKREVGMGCILCMTEDAFPIVSQVWAFPVWAV